MPLRVRKQVKIGGVKLNMGKKGLTSVTVGKTNIGKKGAKTTIPTGIKGVSYTTKRSGCASVVALVLLAGAAAVVILA